MHFSIDNKMRRHNDKNGINRPKKRSHGMPRMRTQRLPKKHEKEPTQQRIRMPKLPANNRLIWGSVLTDTEKITRMCRNDW